MDTWDMIAAERLAQADDAATFSDAEWAAPTPCPRWRVRDVIAHLSADSGGGLKLVVPLLKARFDIDRFIAESAIATATRLDTDELVERLRRHATNRWLAPGVKPPGQLLDNIVHAWDIRQGTGRPVRQRPPEHYRRALDYAVQAGSVFRGGRRAQGLHLVAPDAEWSWGDGPTVTGSGEALLAALIGRSAALDELTGDGVDVLRSRCPAP